MKLKFILFLLSINYLSSQTITPFASYDFKNDLIYQSILSKMKNDEIDLEGYRYLSNLANERKDYKSAIEFLENRLNLGDQTFEVHYKIAGSSGILAKQENSISAIKHINKAIVHFKKALLLNENHIPSLVGLTKLYAQLPIFLGGSLDKSKLYANKIIKYDLIEGNLMNGFIDEINKKKDSAKIKYFKAFEFFNRKYNCNDLIINEKYFRKNILYELAEVSIRFDIFNETSICFLEKFIKESEENIIPKEWVYFRLSELYFKSKNNLKAKFYLNQALILNPNFEEAESLLKMIL